tara:strand:- start:1542 stop:2570 length:1029 start_codon:yes stop_codon:yes gene_type:complete
MAKKVEIKKTVLNKTEFDTAVDRKFSFYSTPEPFIDPDNIDELFRIYDKLYLTIPIEGPEKTHQYLVERSSELYQVDTNLESVQPLLDEIANLRVQILDANRRILELELQLANGSEVSFEDAEKVATLQADLAASQTQVAALEKANTIANAAVETATAAAQKAQEAANKNADDMAENAKKAAAAAAAGGGDAEEVAEIEKMIKNWRKDKVGLAFRFIRKRYSRTYYGTNNIFTMSSHSRISAARGLAKRFYWLYGKDTEDKDYPSNRNGNYGGDYFIPASRNETDDMTLDFFVSELVQAGYKASSIVQAVKNKGNMKGRVSFRVITFKDPNKEDKVGYRLKK